MGRSVLAIVAVAACGGGASSQADTNSSASPGTTTATASTTATGVDGTTTGTSPALGSDSSGGSEVSSSDDGSTGAPAGTLEVHWIDTEGGAATLFVTPGGSLVLVDAGFPGDRDADRIAAVVQDQLGRDGIDLCIVTHYHVDHVGGVPDLVERVPIAAFWDHGDSVEAGFGEGQQLWQDYLALANDDAHNAVQERTANLEDGGGDQGFAITAVVDASGSITVTNERNGHARTYASH